MAKSAITFKFNPLPEGFCPKTTNQLGNVLASRFEGILPDTAGVVYKGSITPPADINGVWLRDTPQGPGGVYRFYNGFWVRAENRRIGEITVWAGNPIGLFDNSGKGLAGSGPVALDWYGWAFCNGQNGTVDLRDRMIICQNDTATPYSTQYRTNVTNVPTTTGGEHQHTLTNDEVPKTPITGTVTIGKSDNRDGSDTEALGTDFGKGSATFNVIGYVNGGEKPHNNMPPYYALAYIQYIGY
jgi:microcystin-dependent protein